MNFYKLFLLFSFFCFSWLLIFRFFFIIFKVSLHSFTIAYFGFYFIFSHSICLQEMTSLILVLNFLMFGNFFHFGLNCFLQTYIWIWVKQKRFQKYSLRLFKKFLKNANLLIELIFLFIFLHQKLFNLCAIRREK